MKLSQGIAVPAIEICPTSNYFTLNLSSYDEHPIFERLFQANYPISINSDDYGVFNTTLSKEYELMQTAYGISNDKLVNLTGKDVTLCSYILFMYFTSNRTCNWSNLCQGYDSTCERYV